VSSTGEESCVWGRMKNLCREKVDNTKPNNYIPLLDAVKIVRQKFLIIVTNFVCLFMVCYPHCWPRINTAPPGPLVGEWAGDEYTSDISNGTLLKIVENIDVLPPLKGPLGLVGGGYTRV